jgi:hypothetical protein
MLEKSAIMYKMYMLSEQCGYLKAGTSFQGVRKDFKK